MLETKVASHPGIQNGNHFKFNFYILAVRSLIEVGKYMF